MQRTSRSLNSAVPGRHFPGLCAHETCDDADAPCTLQAYCYSRAMYGSALVRSLFSFTLLGLAGDAVAQQQGFRVCNRTPASVDVAKALYTGATDGKNRIIISEGWWKVRPGACLFLWEGPLQSRYYLLYASSPETGREWKGKIPICVEKGAFTIRADVCGPQFERRLFFELDTGDEKDLATFTFN